MQIVIDIPEEDYKGICNLRNAQLRMLPAEVAETLVRIANGTPFDWIRAEIEQTAKDYDKFDDYRRVRGLWIALEIIDKYKIESERI